MIHYFNPGHETAVMNGSKYYMAPSNVANMLSDLAFLPAFYATNNDFIYLQTKLPYEFACFWNDKFRISPSTFTKKDIPNIKDGLKNRHVNFWGISPQASHLFESLNNEHNLSLLIPEWDDRYKALNDRHTSGKCLEYIVNSNKRFSGQIIPKFFTSLDDIENYISSNSKTLFLAKAPYSSSGRGLLWLPIGGLTRTERQILHGHIKKQGSVSIEKVLDKKLDFAMEFYLNNKEVHFKGFSLFQTNEKGAYISNYLGNQEDILNKISQYIPFETLKQAEKLLSDYLKKQYSSFYNGYIGVDMMVYEEAGKLQLHPCVEINARYNMGLLANNISERIVDKNSEGYFYIDFSSKPSETLNKHTEMAQKYPLVLSENKIISGYLSLCPILPQTMYRAYILVRPK